MNSRLKSVLSATGPTSMLVAGASMVVLAGVTLSPPPAQPGAAPAVQLVSVTTPLAADGDNDSGFPSDDLFSSADGSRGTEHRNGNSGGFTDRQERVVEQKEQKSWWEGFGTGFKTGHDVGSSAPANSGGHDKDNKEKSEKKDNDDLEDQLEDFQDDLKKIAKTQGGGGSSGGDSSDGKSSNDEKGGSGEAGGGGLVSSLLAAIGQFVSALLSTVQGATQG